VRTPVSIRIKGKPYFNSELTNAGVLNDAVREKRFADAVLGSWAMTEVQVDGIFQLALGIIEPSKDKRFAIVHDYQIPFGLKLRFAKETGSIDEDEYKKIDKFNTLRNALNHTKKKGPAWFFTISEEDKEDVVKSGWESAHASFTALMRLSDRVRLSIVNRE
jgi:hypothetical protein